MPENGFSERITDLALGWAWSLWTELGVSGWDRRAQDEAIDLEPLILFTSWVGELDHRLLDESLDWCLTNGRFVSATRLRRLLKGAHIEVAAAFGAYAATLRALAPKLNWPGEGDARSLRPSGKSVAPSLERPSMFQLRLRALFGVSSRAEVLRLLLMAPPGTWSVADLASEAGYAKVNVASSLEMLASAGAVEVQRSGNQFRYRLSRGAELAGLVAPVPAFQPDWTARLHLAAELVQIARDPGLGSGIAEAANLLGRLRNVRRDLDRLGLAKTVPTATGTEFTGAFEQWAVQLLAYWTGDRGSGWDGVRYEVSRNELGWETLITETGRPSRPLTLPDWDERYKEMPRSDHLISDDSVGAYLLAHELIRRAALRQGIEIGPFTYQPEVLAFAQEQLRPMPQGQIRSFSEAFIQLWRGERVARMGIQRSP